MAFLPKLGQALQGFGAGVAGKGQEFLETLDDNRKQALLEDAFTVREQLKTGDVEGAKLVLKDRIDAIAKLGGDDRDTLEILKQITRGDIQGAFNSVSTVVNFAQQSGLLTAPDAATPDKLERVNGQIVNVNEATAVPIAGFTPQITPDKFQVVGNQRVNVTQNVAEDIEGFKQPPVKPEKESTTREKLRLMAGVIFKSRSTPGGPGFRDGFTEQDAFDEAVERQLLGAGLKIGPQGNALAVSPLADTSPVKDIPIESVLGEIERPPVTALEVADNVAGPIARTAQVTENFLSFFGLDIDSKLSQQRRMVLGLLPGLIQSRSVNKSRVSVVERKDILRDLGIGPSFFIGPAEFSGNIRALDSLLAFDEMTDLALLKSTGISAAARDQAKQQLLATRGMRAMLGNIYVQQDEIEIIPVP